MQMSSSISLWKNPVVVRLLLIAVCAEIAFAALNIVSMPLYLREDRGLDEGVVGLILSLFLFSEAVLKSPLGHLADKVGCRRLLVIAPLLSVTSSFLTVFAPTGGLQEGVTMAALRLLDGVAAAMIWPALFAAMGEAVEESQHQESLSLLNTCYFVGIAVAFPLAGLINNAFASMTRNSTGLYSSSFFFAAAMFGLCSLAAATSKLPEKPHHHAADETEPVKLLDGFRRIPKFVILGAVVFISLGLPMPNIQFFARDELGLSQSAFGALVFPGAVLMALASTSIAAYGKRLGEARAVHYGLALCLSGVLVITSAWAFPALRTTLVFATAGVPLGVGFLLAIPAWYATVSAIDPARRGTNIGAVMASQGIGAIFGVLIGGLSYKRIGHFAPFAGCAIALAIALFLSTWLIPCPKAVGGDSGESA